MKRNSILLVLAAVASLAALTAGSFCLVSVRSLLQLHSTARREQQAEQQEWEKAFKEHNDEQAQALAKLQERKQLQIKQNLEQVQQLNQQRNYRRQQQRNRMQQLDTALAQLLSQRPGLRRNSPEYREATIKFQAIRAAQIRLQETETAEFSKQMRIDRLTSEADEIKYELWTGLAKRPDSKQYQETTNKLSGLRDEFLKMADPDTVACYSNSFSFDISGPYAARLNEGADDNSLISATMKAGQSQRERINTLRLEGNKKIQSIVLRGLFFVLSLGAFIAIAVVAWKTRPRSGSDLE